MCNEDNRPEAIGQSDHATTKQKPASANRNHDDIEVAPARPVRHRANRKANDGDWNDDPIGPTQQWNKGRNDEDQGKQPDED